MTMGLWKLFGMTRQSLRKQQIEDDDEKEEIENSRSSPQIGRGNTLQGSGKLPENYLQTMAQFIQRSEVRREELG